MSPKLLLKWQPLKTPTFTGWKCQIGNETIYRYDNVPDVVAFRQKAYDVKVLPDLVKIIKEDFVMKEGTKQL